MSEERKTRDPVRNAINGLKVLLASGGRLSAASTEEEGRDVASPVSSRLGQGYQHLKTLQKHIGGGPASPAEAVFTVSKVMSLHVELLENAIELLEHGRCQEGEEMLQSMCFPLMSAVLAYAAQVDAVSAHDAVDTLFPLLPLLQRSLVSYSLYVLHHRFDDHSSVSKTQPTTPTTPASPSFTFSPSLAASMLGAAKHSNTWPEASNFGRNAADGAPDASPMSCHVFHSLLISLGAALAGSIKALKRAVTQPSATAAAEEQEAELCWASALTQRVIDNCLQLPDVLARYVGDTPSGTGIMLPARQPSNSLGAGLMELHLDFQCSMKLAIATLAWKCMYLCLWCAGRAQGSASKRGTSVKEAEGDQFQFDAGVDSASVGAPDIDDDEASDVCLDSSNITAAVRASLELVWSTSGHAVLHTFKAGAEGEQLAEEKAEELVEAAEAAVLEGFHAFCDQFCFDEASPGAASETNSDSLTSEGGAVPRSGEWMRARRVEQQHCTPVELPPHDEPTDLALIRLSRMVGTSGTLETMPPQLPLHLLLAAVKKAASPQAEPVPAADRSERKESEATKSFSYSTTAQVQQTQGMSLWSLCFELLASLRALTCGPWVVEDLVHEAEEGALLRPVLTPLESSEDALSSSIPCPHLNASLQDAQGLSRIGSVVVTGFLHGSASAIASAFAAAHVKSKAIPGAPAVFAAPSAVFRPNARKAAASHLGNFQFRCTIEGVLAVLSPLSGRAPAMAATLLPHVFHPTIESLFGEDYDVRVSGEEGFLYHLFPPSWSALGDNVTSSGVQGQPRVSSGPTLWWDGVTYDTPLCFARLEREPSTLLQFLGRGGLRRLRQEETPSLSLAIGVSRAYVPLIETRLGETSWSWTSCKRSPGGTYTLTARGSTYWGLTGLQWLHRFLSEIVAAKCCAGLACFSELSLLVSGLLGEEVNLEVFQRLSTLSGLARYVPLHVARCMADLDLITPFSASISGSYGEKSSDGSSNWNDEAECLFEADLARGIAHEKLRIVDSLCCHSSGFLFNNSALLLDAVRMETSSSRPQSFTSSLLGLTKHADLGGAAVSCLLHTFDAAREALATRDAFGLLPLTQKSSRDPGQLRVGSYQPRQITLEQVAANGDPTLVEFMTSKAWRGVFNAGRSAFPGAALMQRYHSKGERRLPLRTLFEQYYQDAYHIFVEVTQSSLGQWRYSLANLESQDRKEHGAASPETQWLLWLKCSRLAWASMLSLSAVKVWLPRGTVGMRRKGYSRKYAERVPKFHPLFKGRNLVPPGSSSGREDASSRAGRTVTSIDSKASLQSKRSDADAYSRRSFASLGSSAPVFESMGGGSLHAHSESLRVWNSRSPRDIQQDCHHIKNMKEEHLERSLPVEAPQFAWVPFHVESQRFPDLLEACLLDIARFASNPFRCLVPVGQAERSRQLLLKALVKWSWQQKVAILARYFVRIHRALHSQNNDAHDPLRLQRKAEQASAICCSVTLGKADALALFDLAPSDEDISGFTKSLWYEQQWPLISRHFALCLIEVACAGVPMVLHDRQSRSDFLLPAAAAFHAAVLTPGTSSNKIRRLVPMPQTLEAYIDTLFGDAINGIPGTKERFADPRCGLSQAIILAPSALEMLVQSLYTLPKRQQLEFSSWCVAGLIGEQRLRNREILASGGYSQSKVALSLTEIFLTELPYLSGHAADVVFVVIQWLITHSFTLTQLKTIFSTIANVVAPYTLSGAARSRSKRRSSGAGAGEEHENGEEEGEGQREAEREEEGGGGLGSGQEYHTPFSLDAEEGIDGASPEIIVHSVPGAKLQRRRKPHVADALSQKIWNLLLCIKKAIVDGRDLQETQRRRRAVRPSRYFVFPARGGMLRLATSQRGNTQQASTLKFGLPGWPTSHGFTVHMWLYIDSLNDAVRAMAPADRSGLQVQMKKTLVRKGLATPADFNSHSWEALPESCILCAWDAKGRYFTIGASFHNLIVTAGHHKSEPEVHRFPVQGIQTNRWVCVTITQEPAPWLKKSSSMSVYVDGHLEHTISRKYSKLGTNCPDVQVVLGAGVAMQDMRSGRRSSVLDMAAVTSAAGTPATAPASPAQASSPFDVWTQDWTATSLQQARPENHFHGRIAGFTLFAHTTTKEQAMDLYHLGPDLSLERFPFHEAAAGPSDAEASMTGGHSASSAHSGGHRDGPGRTASGSREGPREEHDDQEETKEGTAAAAKPHLGLKVVLQRILLHFNPSVQKGRCFVDVSSDLCSIPVQRSEEISDFEALSDKKRPETEAKTAVGSSSISRWHWTNVNIAPGQSIVAVPLAATFPCATHDPKESLSFLGELEASLAALRILYHGAKMSLHPGTASPGTASSPTTASPSDAGMSPRSDHRARRKQQQLQLQLQAHRHVALESILGLTEALLHLNHGASARAQLQEFILLLSTLLRTCHPDVFVKSKLFFTWAKDICRFGLETAQYYSQILLDFSIWKRLPWEAQHSYFQHLTEYALSSAPMPSTATNWFLRIARALHKEYSCLTVAASLTEANSYDEFASLFATKYSSLHQCRRSLYGLLTLLPRSPAAFALLYQYVTSAVLLVTGDTRDAEDGSGLSTVREWAVLLDTEGDIECLTALCLPQNTTRQRSGSGGVQYRMEVSAPADLFSEVLAVLSQEAPGQYGIDLAACREDSGILAFPTPVIPFLPLPMRSNPFASAIHEHLREEGPRFGGELRRGVALSRGFPEEASFKGPRKAASPFDMPQNSEQFVSQLFLLCTPLIPLCQPRFGRLQGTVEALFSAMRDHLRRVPQDLRGSGYMDLAITRLQSAFEAVGRHSVTIDEWDAAEEEAGDNADEEGKMPEATPRFGAIIVACGRTLNRVRREFHDSMAEEGDTSQSLSPPPAGLEDRHCSTASSGTEEEQEQEEEEGGGVVLEGMEPEQLHSLARRRRLRSDTPEGSVFTFREDITSPGPSPMTPVKSVDTAPEFLGPAGGVAMLYQMPHLLRDLSRSFALQSWQHSDGAVETSVKAMLEKMKCRASDSESKDADLGAGDRLPATIPPLYQLYPTRVLRCIGEQLFCVQAERTKVQVLRNIYSSYDPAHASHVQDELWQWPYVQLLVTHLGDSSPSAHCAEIVSLLLDILFVGLFRDANLATFQHHLQESIGMAFLAGANANETFTSPTTLSAVFTLMAVAWRRVASPTTATHPHLLSIVTAMQTVLDAYPDLALNAEQQEFLGTIWASLMALLSGKPQSLVVETVQPLGALSWTAAEDPPPSSLVVVAAAARPIADAVEMKRSKRAAFVGACLEKLNDNRHCTPRDRLSVVASLVVLMHRIVDGVFRPMKDPVLGALQEQWKEWSDSSAGYTEGKDLKLPAPSPCPAKDIDSLLYFQTSTVNASTEPLKAGARVLLLKQTREAHEALINGLVEEAKHTKVAWTIAMRLCCACSSAKSMLDKHVEDSGKQLIAHHAGLEGIKQSSASLFLVSSLLQPGEKDQTIYLKDQRTAAPSVYWRRLNIMDHLGCFKLLEPEPSGQSHEVASSAPGISGGTSAAYYRHRQLPPPPQAAAIFPRLEVSTFWPNLLATGRETFNEVEAVAASRPRQFALYHLQRRLDTAPSPTSSTALSASPLTPSMPIRRKDMSPVDEYLQQRRTSKPRVEYSTRSRRASSHTSIASFATLPLAPATPPAKAPPAADPQRKKDDRICEFEVIVVTPLRHTLGVLTVYRDELHFTPDMVQPSIVSGAAGALSPSVSPASQQQHHHSGEDRELLAPPCPPFVVSTKDLAFMERRQFLLERRAMEVFLRTRVSHFFVFKSKQQRNTFSQAVRRHCSVPNLNSYEGDKKHLRAAVNFVTLLWQQRKISNFEFLMRLNRLAGRTTSDLSQYPVFPWVLADYTSTTLDLNDPNVYRDLQYPISAQHEDTRETLLKSYKDSQLLARTSAMYDTFSDEAGPEGSGGGGGGGGPASYTAVRTHSRSASMLEEDAEAQPGEDKDKKPATLSAAEVARLSKSMLEIEHHIAPGAPSHHRTGYSAPASVFWYLIRMEPYTSLHIVHQDGFFDAPNRQFHSIEGAFQSATRDKRFGKELIPEFFYLPDFLLNINGLKLGRRHDGAVLGDVVLPPWAQGSPLKFIEMNRRALESEYVSQHLHKWVDLVFGFRQTGQPAIDSFNVYPSIMYPNKRFQRDFHLGLGYNTPQLSQWQSLYASFCTQLENCGQMALQLYTSEVGPRMPWTETTGVPQLFSFWSTHIPASCGLVGVPFEEGIKHNKRTRPFLLHLSAGPPVPRVHACPVMFLRRSTVKRSNLFLTLGTDRRIGVHSMPDPVPVTVALDSRLSEVAESAAVLSKIKTFPQFKFLPRSHSSKKRDESLRLPNPLLLRDQGRAGLLPQSLLTPGRYSSSAFSPASLINSMGSTHSDQEDDGRSRSEAITQKDFLHGTSSDSRGSLGDSLPSPALAPIVAALAKELPPAFYGHEPASSMSPARYWPYFLARWNEANTSPSASKYPFEPLVQRITASMDCEFIVTCGHWDETFKVVDVRDGIVRRAVRGHTDIVTCAVLVPETESPMPRPRTLINKTEDRYVPSYEWLVTGSADSTVCVWAFREGITDPSPRSKLQGHGTAVTCVATDPDLNIVFSGSVDGTCCVHTLRGGHLLRTISRPWAAVSAPIKWVGVSRMGVLASYCAATAVLACYSTNGQLLAKRAIVDPSGDQEVYCFEWSVDGSALLVGGKMPYIQVFDAFTLKHIQSITAFGTILRQHPSSLAGGDGDAADAPQVLRSGEPSNFAFRAHAELVDANLPFPCAVTSMSLLRNEAGLVVGLYTGHVLVYNPDLSVKINTAIKKLASFGII